MESILLQPLKFGMPLKLTPALFRSSVPVLATWLEAKMSHSKCDKNALFILPISHVNQDLIITADVCSSYTCALFPPPLSQRHGHLLSSTRESPERGANSPPALRATSQ